MRAHFIGISIVLLAAGSASAQSAMEGPPASPEASAPKPAAAAAKKSQRKARAGRDKTKTAHDKPLGFAAERHPDAEPVLSSPGAAPADPLSFGMKWNGSSDDARATRVQNYNGDAQGTGAEVGMKLHF